MSDLSFSLDDYIKKQKKQNAKNSKGGSPRKQGGRGGGGGGGKLRVTATPNTGRNSQNRMKGKKGRGLAVGLRGRGGVGRQNLNISAGTPVGRKQLPKAQFKRINNRVNAQRGGRNRGATEVSSKFDRRAQRFGGSPNTSAQSSSSLRNFNQGGPRNQRKQKNWKNNRPIKTVARASYTNFNTPKKANRNRLSLTTVSVAKAGTSSNRRPGNRRLQQLIQKRIKNARSLLTSKVNARSGRVLTTPKGFRGRFLNKVNSPNRGAAEQKLNRAKLIRARIRNNKLSRAAAISVTRNKSSDNRGLSVDRNNIVRVRVANEFSQQQSFGNPYASAPMSLFGSSSSHYQNPYGPPSPYHQPPEFPPFTMHNSAAASSVDEIEVCRQSLDPNIQRKISVIQNRARNSNSNSSPTRVLSDFKCPVSSSNMKLGDRFRMMMH